MGRKFRRNGQTRKLLPILVSVRKSSASLRVNSHSRPRAIAASVPRGRGRPDGALKMATWHELAHSAAIELDITLRHCKTRMPGILAVILLCSLHGMRQLITTNDSTVIRCGLHLPLGISLSVVILQELCRLLSRIIHAVVPTGVAFRMSSQKRSRFLGL